MLVKKEKKLRNYEMIMALKPLLPDDLRKELHKTFVDMIESEGGELLDVDVWGKRYLTYNIAGHNEGYYIVYAFKTDPKVIKEFTRQLRLKQEILRFMIVVKENTEEIGTRIKKKEIEV